MLMFYLSAVLWFGMVTGIKYEDCGSTSTLLNVTVSQCASDTVCIVPLGDTTTVDIYFIPRERVEKMTVNVTGSYYGTPVPLTDPSIVNGCKGSGLSCPLQPDQPQHYIGKLRVKQSYPTTTLGIQWKLTDEQKNTVVCTTFLGRLL